MFRRVELAEYHPRWSVVFQEESERVKAVFGDNLIMIQHIGGTAIPGLLTRPMIDILVTLRDYSLIDQYRALLRKMGYQDSPNHPAVGTVLIKGGGKHGPISLGIFHMGYHRQAIIDPINVKNYLLKHPLKVKRYSQVRKQSSQNLDSYHQAKNKFLYSIGAPIRIYVARQAIVTNRLILKPFVFRDAARIRDIIMTDKEIANNSVAIPYPYEQSIAEEWIKAHRKRCRRWEELIFGVTLKETGALIGAVGISTINHLYQSGELGYWLAKAHWNKGYATEAGKAMLHLGFTQIGLNRISAYHFSYNPASGRVMQKLGMTYEGHFRQHVIKWGKFEDTDQYAILSTDNWNR